MSPIQSTRQPNFVLSESCHGFVLVLLKGVTVGPSEILGINEIRVRDLEALFPSLTSMDKTKLERNFRSLVKNVKVHGFNQVTSTTLAHCQWQKESEPFLRD